MTLELFLDPAATTSRSVLLFCREHAVDTEIHTISLMNGDHRTPAFTAVNAHQMVPVIRDGDFVLTEAAAILRFLGPRYAPETYPAQRHARARVDEVMDWLNSQLYRDLGFNLIYPQLLPNRTCPKEPVVDSSAALAGKPRVVGDAGRLRALRRRVLV